MLLHIVNLHSFNIHEKVMLFIMLLEEAPGCMQSKVRLEIFMTLASAGKYSTIEDKNTLFQPKVLDNGN